MPEQLPISVVVSTREHPDEFMDAYDETLAEVLKLGGEFIVITAADEPPADNRRGNAIAVHHMPGSTVHRGRAEAFRIARGKVVALTEDHCEPDKGWVSRVVEAFANDPGLDMLGGPVRNGSVERFEDRMNYYMTFPHYDPDHFTAKMPCIANIAIRASAIDNDLESGELETTVIPQLARQPGKSRMDPDIVITHTQSYGPAGTFRSHFHNGRTAAGISPRRDRVPNPGHFRSLRWALRDMRAHLWTAMRANFSGPRGLLVGPARTLIAMPLMLTTATGAYLGYRHGKGESEKQLA